MANVFKNLYDRVTGAKPAPGQSTGKQGSKGGAATMYGMLQGFGPPPPGSWKLYREMRGNPTIAMARAAAYAPVKASQWTLEEEEGAPAGALEFLEDTLIPMRSCLLNDLRFALDYGRASFEKVYEYTTLDGSPKLVLKKLKPLLVEKTKILTVDATGEFAGLENQGVTLGPEKSYLFTYDREAGNLEGRSRNENTRGAYHCWKETLERAGAYVMKSSGVTPILRYPEGRSRGEGGSMIDNYDIASQILQNLGRAQGVAMPDVPAKWAREYMEQGGKITDAESWRLNFLEVASGHGVEFTTLLQYFDKLLVRGWLVPERAVTEATLAGSRADAESSTDLALLIAQELLDDIIESINKDVIDPLIELNYGPETAGLVYLKAEPLNDQAKALVREMIKAVLTNPGNADLFFALLDIDNMLDQTGVPRLKDAADIDLLQRPGSDPNAKDKLNAAEGMGTPSDAIAKPTTEPGQIETSQDTVLNGAQVTAATAIVTAVAAGDIPRDSGIGQLETLFNLTTEQANRIMGSAGTNTPTTPNPNPAKEAEQAAERKAAEDMPPAKPEKEAA